MRKDLALGLGEANAVDDAGVVQGIADDRGALGREDRDDAGVAGEARLEGQDRLDVLEGGEARLELLMQAHGAGDGAHGSGAGSVPLDGLDCRPTELGMGVEPEVVVRGERDHLAAVNDAPAALLALDDAQSAVEALGLELLDLALEECERIAGSRGRCGRGDRDSVGHGMSTTFPACREAMSSKPRSQSARSKRWVRMGVGSKRPERRSAWVRSQES